MELQEYKNNKINELLNFYQSKINSQIELYKKRINSVRRNFLVSIFQRNIQSKKLESELKNILDLLKKELDLKMNEIKNIPISKVIYPQNSKNKKALLIGINYEDTIYKLNGCINDINLMNTYLMDKHFSKITMLSDKTEKKPTKNNIIKELVDFLKNSDDNDILYFHYSGHGSFTKDQNGEEIDGKDETIVSKDLLNITDDELISIIKQNLKEKVTLIAIFDSCHSGTVLDLDYCFDCVGKENKLIIKENQLNNIKNIKNIIMLSGCKDDQYSQEVTSNTTGMSGGLLTWAIYEILSKNKMISWKQFYLLLKSLLKNSGAIQIPQLSMGSLFDINELIML